MNDLAEFLLARVAEDERIAADGDRGSGCGFADYELAVTVVPPRSEVKSTPDRIRAECQAKRRIVENWRWANWPARYMLGSQAPLAEMNEEFDRGAAHGLLLAMQIVALPYSGHPDYSEEWKP